jgi:hypothetical protein
MPMNKYFFLVLVSFCSLFSSIAIAQNINIDNTSDRTNTNTKNSVYIGLQYQNPPQGLTSLGGWVIGDVYATTIFGISQIQKGSQRMLWLEIISYDPDGKTQYRVLDVLDLPPLESNDDVTTYCRVRGTIDAEIVTISVYENTELLTKIKRAWRANRKIGKFEVIPTDGLACENIGYGV